METTKKDFPRAQFGKFITIYPENEIHFKKVILDINTLTEPYQFKGTYILTDKRYESNSILYYRYGGVKSNVYIDDNLDEVYYIQDGYGNLVEDVRVPYFTLPNGITDPFMEIEEPSDSINEMSIFFEKYRVMSAIKFTNVGGVYLAENKYSEKFILKESRPYTERSKIDDNQSSIQFKENEYKILKRFENSAYFPKAFEFTKVWENYFLVTEFIEGKTLDDFAKDNPLFKPGISREAILDYLKQSIEIFKALITMVSDVNIELRTYLVDISPSNIIYNDITKKIYIIDIETARNRDAVDNINHIHRTFGYFDYRTNEINENSEMYSTAMCMIHLLLFEHSNLYSIKHPYEIIEEIADYYKEIFNIDISKLGNILSKMIGSNGIETWASITKEIETEKLVVQDYFCESNKKINLNQTINNVSKSIMDNVFINNDFFDNKQIPYFTKNRLSFWYGSSGIVYTISKIKKDILYDYHKSLSEREVIAYLDSLPITFGKGVLGVYYPLLSINESIEISSYLVDKIKVKLKNDTLSSLENGISGIGIFLLEAFKHTKDLEFLSLAKECARKIINEKKFENEVGVSFGPAGASIFLAKLDYYTGDKNYEKICRELLEDELLRIVYIDGVLSGISKSKDSKIPYIYQNYGSSGVLKSLIFYQKIYNSNYFEKEIKQLETSINIFATTSVGYSYGVSSLIDVYHDLTLLYPNEQKYSERMNNLLRYLMIHEIKHEGNTYYPSDFLKKVSFDYGAGMSGILNVLMKIRDNIEYNPYFNL